MCVYVCVYVRMCVFVCVHTYELISWMCVYMSAEV